MNQMWDVGRGMWEEPDVTAISADIWFLPHPTSHIYLGPASITMVNSAHCGPSQPRSPSS